MLTLHLRCTLNGFAVGNLRLADICLNVKLALHAVDEDFEMELAHAGHDRLTGIFIGMNAECRVFFCEALQSDAHFFLIGFRFRFNSD